MVDTTATQSVAMAEITEVTTQVAAFGGTIEILEVEDDDTLAQMGQFVKMMNHRRLKLEDKRKSLVGPLNKVVKDINALFKAPRDRIDELLKIARDRMTTYQRAQKAIADELRRQEIEKARKEQEEAQELANALAEKAGVESAPVVETIVEQAQTKVEEAEAPAKVAVVRSEDASVVMQRVWKAEVIDLQELALAVGEGRLPARFLEPNMKALTDYGREKKEQREYAGVRWYEDVNTVVR